MSEVPIISERQGIGASSYYSQANRYMRVTPQFLDTWEVQADNRPFITNQVDI